jgi:hypothetical protein
LKLLSCEGYSQYIYVKTFEGFLKAFCHLYIWYQSPELDLAKLTPSLLLWLPALLPALVRPGMRSRRLVDMLERLEVVRASLRERLHSRMHQPS